jgi:hypothetical protein
VTSCMFGNKSLTEGMPNHTNPGWTSCFAPSSPFKYGTFRPLVYVLEPAEKEGDHRDGLPLGIRNDSLADNA